MWNLKSVYLQSSTASAALGSITQARIMPAATMGATKSVDFLRTSSWARSDTAGGDSCSHLTSSINSEEANAGNQPWKRNWQLSFGIFEFFRLILEPLRQRLITTFRAFHTSEPLGSKLLSARGEYESPSDHLVHRSLAGKYPDWSRHRHTQSLPSSPNDTNYANGFLPHMHWQHNSDPAPFGHPLQLQRGCYHPVTPGHHHLHATDDTTVTDTQRDAIIGGLESSVFNTLPKPNARWSVATSWRLQDPSRCSIPRAFLAYPKERHDLLSVQQYKSLRKENSLALKQQIPEAERLFNACEREETELLLALDANGHDWEDLDSDLALAVARAARKTSEAKKHLADIKVAHAQVLLQQLIDEAEEASSFTEEADHQIMPIINAFKECGWTIDDLTTHCCHIVHRYLNTTKPLNFAQIKQSVSKYYSDPSDFPDHSPASEPEERSYYSEPDSG